MRNPRLGLRVCPYNGSQGDCPESETHLGENFSAMRGPGVLSKALSKRPGLQLLMLLLFTKFLSLEFGDHFMMPICRYLYRSGKRIKIELSNHES